MTAVSQTDLAAEVAAELRELADVAAALTAAEWDAATLCTGWRVREVVGHVTMPARWSGPAVLGGLVRARFDWHTFADRAARKDAQLSTGELVAALRSDKLAAWRPPGGGVHGALVHAVVHGLDVTVPLGIERGPAPERLRAVLDGLTDPKSMKHFGVHLDGIALRATDVDWSHGSGREVTTDARGLVLVLSGRRPLT